MRINLGIGSILLKQPPRKSSHCMEQEILPKVHYGGFFTLQKVDCQRKVHYNGRSSLPYRGSAVLSYWRCTTYVLHHQLNKVASATVTDFSRSA